MSDEIRNTDDAKGRVKEAAGDLTGDKDLKREGKVDQAGGKAKDGVEKVTDKVKDALKGTDRRDASGRGPRRAGGAGRRRRGRPRR